MTNYETPKEPALILTEQQADYQPRGIWVDFDPTNETLKINHKGNTVVISACKCFKMAFAKAVNELMTLNKYRNE